MNTPALAPRQAVDEGEVSSVGWRRVAAIACVLAATVLVVLDAAVANVALPDIARSLGVLPAASLGVVTAYQLALVVALLPFGALGESRGARRVYTAGVALFVFASLFCAEARSLPILVGARFVQGIGGAAILSLGTALLRHVVPASRLGAAIGWYAMSVALASATGPTIGALVLSAAGWPAIFAINLPLGALVLFATRALPPVPGHSGTIDATSVALNAALFGGLVLGAEQLPERLALALGLFAVGVVAAVLLVRREASRPTPMLPLDLLRAPSFRLAVLASIACFAGQSAAMVSLPFHLHHGLGLDALHTGLLITPWPLTVALVAPIAGRLADRYSTATLCATGGVTLALGLACAALVPPASGPFALVPCVMLAGLGFGLFQVPNNRTLLLSAPKERSAAAGGMQGTARLTGQTLGALLVTMLFASTPLEVAPRLGLGLASILTLGSALVSLTRARSERTSDGGPAPCNAPIPSHD